jgi:flagellar hook-associated protein 2
MSSAAITNLFQPITFSGLSEYSSDFQSILDRAQSIADLPLQSLDNEQTNLQSEVSAAQSLQSTVGTLTSAVQALGSLGSTGLTANSSDSSIVTAQATSATSDATYNITNITSIATSASESSTQGYADAATTQVSSTGSLNLVVGNTTTPITLASGQNNLSGLVNAINNANAGVTATILTTSDGDYLSVSANSPGYNPISLNDDPTGSNTDLLTDQNPGANTSFDLNGVPVSEPNTTISDVVPGLTFTIEGTTSANQTVSISLSPDASQLSSDLQNLVSAYNAAGQAVTAQTGTSAGALAGNPLIWQTTSAMNQLVNYYDPSNSAIHSLADLGISVDQTGTMSFNSDAISALSSSQLAAAFQFLGSATTGLGAQANNFDAISDPVTGSAQSLITNDNNTLTSLGDQITDMTNNIEQNLTSLQSQLEAADSSVAQLESQQQLLTSNIDALNYSTYGQSVLSNQGL